MTDFENRPDIIEKTTTDEKVRYVLNTSRYGTKDIGNTTALFQAAYPDSRISAWVVSDSVAIVEVFNLLRTA